MLYWRAAALEEITCELHVNVNTLAGINSTNPASVYMSKPNSKRRGVTTRKTLILRLQGDGAEDAWNEFFFLYKDFIFNIARKMSLQTEDAEDLVNAIFCEIHKQFKEKPDLDFSNQSFGGWLGNLVKWRSYDFIRSSKRQLSTIPLEGDFLTIGELPFENVWQKEWNQKLVIIALSRMSEKPRNVQIYIDLAIRESSVSDVCSRFGISKSNAETIKNRVNDKLKPIIESLNQGEI